MHSTCKRMRKDKHKKHCRAIPDSRPEEEKLLREVCKWRVCWEGRREKGGRRGREERGVGFGGLRDARGCSRGIYLEKS